MGSLLFSAFFEEKLAAVFLMANPISQKQRTVMLFLTKQKHCWFQASGLAGGERHKLGISFHRFICAWRATTHHCYYQSETGEPSHTPLLLPIRDSAHTQSSCPQMKLITLETSFLYEYVQPEDSCAPP